MKKLLMALAVLALIGASAGTAHARRWWVYPPTYVVAGPRVVLVVAVAGQALPGLGAVRMEPGGRVCGCGGGGRGCATTCDEQCD